MKKIIPGLIIILIQFTPHLFSSDRREYLVSGQNTVQRIYYSTSSSLASTYRGNKAMDSDKKTTWLSKKEKGPHWLAIDFVTKRIMTKIKIFPGRKDNYPTLKNIKLQFLHQGKWFDFAEQKTKINFFGNKTEPVTFNLGGIDASTFRIFIPEGSTCNGFAAIAEIETYTGSTKIEFHDRRLKGLCMPIRRGFLPSENYFYPGAPRKYRGGRHAGIDIYKFHAKSSYDPLPVTRETPVLAAREGVIIRADHNYRDMSPDEWKKQSRFYRSNPRTFVKRSFGGIQVWIDHLDGIVTTYNHLSRIQPGVKVGSSVKRCEVIGYAGNSGLLSAAKGNGDNVHLHFEIWVNGYYLGSGMSIDEIKKYFIWIFYDTQ